MVGLLFGAVLCENLYIHMRAAAIKRHQVLHEWLGDDWCWHEKVINAVYPF